MRARSRAYNPPFASGLVIKALGSPLKRVNTLWRGGLALAPWGHPNPFIYQTRRHLDNGLFYGTQRRIAPVTASAGVCCVDESVRPHFERSSFEAAGSRSSSRRLPSRCNLATVTVDGLSPRRDAAPERVRLTSAIAERHWHCRRAGASGWPEQTSARGSRRRAFTRPGLSTITTCSRHSRGACDPTNTPNAGLLFDDSRLQRQI